MDNKKTIPDTGSQTTSFPVFVKLEELKLLIVGGGNIGLEKLQTVLQNSPSTADHRSSRPRSTRPSVNWPPGTRISGFWNVLIIRQDLEYADLAIVAVNDRTVSETVAREARARGILVNVADTPDLCDFYLGSVVRRGNLKIAISTNGKSPTIAKRLKEEIGNMIPDEMDAVLDNMQTIRTHLNGDFAEKVRRLNELTSVLASPPTRPPACKPNSSAPSISPPSATAKQEKQILLPGPRPAQMAADRQMVPVRIRLHDHRPRHPFTCPAWRIRRFPAGSPKKFRRPCFRDHDAGRLPRPICRRLDGPGLWHHLYNLPARLWRQSRDRQQPRTFSPRLLQRRLRLQPSSVRQHQ